MKYMLTKDDVIYIIPGKSKFKISCTDGNLWLTKDKDIRDHILTDGDTMIIKNSGKIAVQAFSDSCLILEGQSFNLHELKSDHHKLIVNKIKIRQAGHF